MAAPDRICVGVVTGAHGVKGAVKVKSFTANPEDIAAYGPVSDERGEQVFEIRVVGRSKDRVIAQLGGIADRDAADSLKGQSLFAPRAALPPPGKDEFYHADLIGLRVEGEDGEAMGRVRAIHDFGAGDILEIEAADGKAFMVPFTRPVVPVVDLATRRIVVVPPPGLLEPADGKGRTS